ncbi:hypothetical protein AAH027_06135 [Bacteroides ovatus]
MLFRHLSKLRHGAARIGLAVLRHSLPYLGLKSGQGHRPPTLLHGREKPGRKGTACRDGMP